MIRSEVIRRISRNAGVPDSETKIFFEIFLKRLSTVLRTGQALYIKGIGYLYSLQGKIEKAESEDENEYLQPEIIDLIYFSEQSVKENNSFDGLFFIVPVSEEDEFNAVDASFSLSFGKPLIPFKGIVDTNFFIPHTGSELRMLIESKVDKTIEYSEIKEVTNFLNTVIDFNKILLSKSEDQTEQTITAISFEDLISDKDIKRQIEEDAIIDLAESVDEKTPTDHKPLLRWDFDSFDEIKTDEEKSDLKSVSDVENKLPGEKDVSADYEKKQPDYETTKQKEISTTEPVEKFERVRTLTNEFEENLDEETEKISPILRGKGKIDLDDTIEEKLKTGKAESGFIELNTALRLSVPEKEKVKHKIEKPLQQPSIESTDNISITGERNRLRRQPGRRSANVIPFIMLALSIAIIGSGIYYYLTNIKGGGEKKITETTIRFNTDEMKIIERDFDFPVSYPYPKRIESSEDPVNIFDFKEEPIVVESPPENVTTPVQKELTTGIPEVVTEEPKTVVKNQPPPGVEKRIGVNLFQYGDVYVVQVAAFRSNSVAENEAGRFRNKGYNAFVERAEIDGSYWHRVKVGNFTDIEEAKRLAVQFK